MSKQQKLLSVRTEMVSHLRKGLPCPPSSLVLGQNRRNTLTKKKTESSKIRQGLVLTPHLPTRPSPPPLTKGESLRKSSTVGIGSGMSSSQQLLSPNPGFQVPEMLISDLQKHRPQLSCGETLLRKQHSKVVKDSESASRLLVWCPDST